MVCVLLWTDREAHAPFTTVICRSVAHEDAATAHPFGKGLRILFRGADAGKHEVAMARPELNAARFQCVFQTPARFLSLTDILLDITLVSQSFRQASKRDGVDVVGRTDATQ